MSSLFQIGEILRSHQSAKQSPPPAPAAATPAGRQPPQAAPPPQPQPQPQPQVPAEDDAAVLAVAAAMVQSDEEADFVPLGDDESEQSPEKRPARASTPPLAKPPAAPKEPPQQPRPQQPQPQQPQPQPGKPVPLAAAIRGAMMSGAERARAEEARRAREREASAATTTSGRRRPPPSYITARERDPEVELDCVEFVRDHMRVPGARLVVEEERWCGAVVTSSELVAAAVTSGKGLPVSLSELTEFWTAVGAASAHDGKARAFFSRLGFASAALGPSNTFARLALFDLGIRGAVAPLNTAARAMVEAAGGAAKLAAVRLPRLAAAAAAAEVEAETAKRKRGGSGGGGSGDGAAAAELKGEKGAAAPGAGNGGRGDGSDSDDGSSSGGSGSSSGRRRRRRRVLHSGGEEGKK